MDNIEKLQRQVLLAQDLIEIYDPLEDVKKQVSVAQAKRLAKVNSDVAFILDELGIEYKEEVKEEETK